ncbi:MAG: hypothetical protein MUE60_00355 [Candidatus Eisenbacteria bacterium]|jgi:predicted S18 family serine protease|nr:hypothetical protein [Candidatus Eisenbacteria bacterium]
MRYFVVALLILSLAAPAVLAAKPAKGQTFQAAKVGEKAHGPKEGVQYRIVTLLGGKLSARVPVTPTR